MAKKSRSKKAKRPTAPKKRIARATAEKPIQKPKAATEPQPKAAPEMPPAPQDDSDATVVFAIRLRRSERDLIHKAAGSGKASRFVRTLAVAAAGGDIKQVREIVEAAVK